MDFLIQFVSRFLNEVFYLEDSGVKITVVLKNNGKFIDIVAPTKVLNEKNLYDVYGITTRVLNYKEDDNNYK